MNIEQVIKNFDTACKDLADAVNQKLFDSHRGWFWIGDAIGGLCCFDDVDYLNVDDMRFILAENIDYDEYSEWRNKGLDYNSDKETEDQRWISLKAWHMGARYEMILNNGEW